MSLWRGGAWIAVATLIACGGNGRDGARSSGSVAAPVSVARSSTPVGPGASGASSGTDGPRASPGARPRGLFAVVEWNEAAKEETWSHPDVDGVVVRTYWRDLNPAPQSYRWDLLDGALEAAKKYGKRARFIVVPGFYAPDFVLRDPAVRRATFTVPQGPLADEERELPLPWDDAYLGAWFAFVDRLAARFRDEPAFAYISATGPNAHNGEISLPRQPADEEVWRRLASAEEFERLMLGAWEKTFARFCSAFRGKHFTVAIISEALPGQSHDERAAYEDALAKLGAETCPDGFGLQNNGLDGRPVEIKVRPLPAWDVVARYGGKIFTGFQSRTRANLYHCKRSGRECEGEKRDIFAQMLQNGLTRHASFIEIYERDFADPELRPLLDGAHTALHAAP